MRMFLAALVLFPISLLADPADPWWNTGWRYRVEVNLPAAELGQTGKMNIDFSNLGLPGTFDPGSVRLVKQDGLTLLTEVEYNDNIYNDATDPIGNDTGEVKFIVEDTGVVRYYMYYDSVDNGPYAPLAAASSINGNFEYDVNKWALNDRFVQQSVPDNVVYTGNSSSWVLDAASGLSYFDTQTPDTGNGGYLAGYKTDEENRNRRETVWASRTITFPATNPGTLTFRARNKGWDNVANDFLFVEIGNNNTVLTAGSPAPAGTFYDSGWKTYVIDLTPYAGATLPVNIGIEMGSNNNYKTWVTFDNVEWSITPPVLGPQESIIEASLTKISCVINDNFNPAVDAKRIPGGTVRYAITLQNTGLVDITQAAATDNVSADFDPSTIRNIQVIAAPCDCLGVASASNNGPLGTGDGVNPVVVDFGGINVGQTKCGYFEVDVL